MAVPPGETGVAFFTGRPCPGWSEQGPDVWISACRKVTGDLREGNANAFAARRGIGISGHMHGATLLDENDAPLRPCIQWNDTRSAKEAARLDALPGMREISGNIVFPGFTAPKLEWVRLNEPGIFLKTARVLLPKDYLRLWLTGDHISDMSDSAGTSWLDVGARMWSMEALALTHMRHDQMPELVEGSAPGGAVRRTLRDAPGRMGDKGSGMRGLRRRMLCRGVRFRVSGHIGRSSGGQGQFRPGPGVGGTQFLPRHP